MIHLRYSNLRAESANNIPRGGEQLEWRGNGDIVGTSEEQGSGVVQGEDERKVGEELTAAGFPCNMAQE